jgi:hypothetical protein
MADRASLGIFQAAPLLDPRHPGATPQRAFSVHLSSLA